MNAFVAKLAGPAVFVRPPTTDDRDRGYRCVAPENQPDLLEVYYARRKEVARFLLARLGNQHDAEDVLQELFLKVGRTPTRGILEPSAYLFRMAMNLARDHRRGLMRARARETIWVESRITRSGFEAIDDSPSPEAVYGSKQRLAQVRAVLDGLPAQRQQIFVMHKIEGLSHQEIADRLGISRSAVEKHMHAAVQSLIERLGRG